MPYNRVRCRGRPPVEVPLVRSAAELHLSWTPEAGLHFKTGEGPGTPIALVDFSVHLWAAYVVHGEAEAARLESELAALLPLRGVRWSRSSEVRVDITESR